MMYTGPLLLDIEKYKNVNKLLLKCERISIVNNLNNIYLAKMSSSLFGKKIIDRIDIAFPILHGTNGEDGTVQGYFETLNIPYVGCNVQASAICMDKIMTKKVLKALDLPIVKYTGFYTKKWINDQGQIIKEIEENLKYPYIVKPSKLGSSIGIKKANNIDQLKEAIDIAANYSFQILIEEAVQNLREINCAVLGDYEEAITSVCEEPLSIDEILSYNDKYQQGHNTKGMSGAKRRIPAEISKETSLLIRRLAKETFNGLGCSGVARVDFLLDNKTNEVYVNEVNNIPGSLAYYLWEATGISFNELITKLIQIGLKINREKNNLIVTYESNLLSQNNLLGIKK